MASVFGFAQSKSLEQEKSANAGLRDQRLAIQWFVVTSALNGTPTVHVHVIFLDILFVDHDQ